MLCILKYSVVVTSLSVSKEIGLVVRCSSMLFCELSYERFSKDMKGKFTSGT